MTKRALVVIFVLVAQGGAFAQSASPSHPVRVGSLFEGTWKGTLDRGLLGSLDLTFVMSADGTTVTFKSKTGSFKWQAFCDGKTAKWHGCAAGLDCDWTLTPNEDGKTAVISDHLSGGSFSAIFQKESAAHENEQ